jgi:hypothetical protein
MLLDEIIGQMNDVKVKIDQVKECL